MCFRNVGAGGSRPNRGASLAVCRRVTLGDEVLRQPAVQR